MNKWAIMAGVLLIIIGVLLYRLPVFSKGYLPAAGLGIIFGGAVLAIIGFFAKPRQK